LISNETFVENNKTKRKPGDKWVVYGPGEFYTPFDVKVLAKKKALLVIEPLNLYIFNPIPTVFAILLLYLAYVYGGRVLGL